MAGTPGGSSGFNGPPHGGPNYCPGCVEAARQARLDADERERAREFAREQGLEKWARTYDGLNGAPERDEDQ